MPALQIDIAARLASFQDGLDKVVRQSELMSTRLSSAFSAVQGTLAAVGASLSVGAFAAFMKSAIDAGDELNKLSQKVGISVEKLSELKFAGELSDVSLEQLQLAVRGLGDTMAKANDATSKEAQLLKAIGVSARDPYEALKQIADVIAALPPSFDKGALASELFGAKVGQQLIPLLNGGSKGLDEMGESARKLGLIISTETAKASEQLNDNLDKLSRGTQALGITLATRVVGGLAEFTNGMVKAKEEGDLLRKILSDISGLGLQLASALPGNVGSFFDRIQDLNTKADAARSAAKATSDNIVAGAREFSQRFSNQSVGPPVPPDIEERIRKFFAERNKTPKTGPKDMTLDELRANSAVLRLRRQDQADEEAETEGVAAAKAALDAESALAARRLKFEDDQNAAADERVTRIKEQAQAYIDLIDPVERYRRQLEEINKIESDGGLTGDQADLAREKINKSIRELSTGTQRAKSAAEELGITFSSAFEDAVVSGKKFSDVLKGIGQDITKIVLRKSVTEPLAQALGGTKEKPGLISVGLEKIGKVLGFASGGSFNVGGSGGTDSQLVAFRASPNERVTVETPDQQRRGGSTFNFSIDARGADAGVAQRIDAAVRQAVQLSLQAVQAQADRGGSFARAVGRR